MSRLQRLADELVLSQSEEERIISSLGRVTSIAPKVIPDVLGAIPFGSFVSGTLLPQRFDPDVDVDVLVRF
jgi:predicted nucleotidyltransferase